MREIHSDGKTFARKVASRGPLPARILGVGEAPGVSEAERGTVFVGKTGIELERYCKQQGIDIRDVRLTNVVRYRPFTRGASGNVQPTIQDIKRDEPELIDEIRQCKPRFIMAIGAVAAKWLLRDKYDSMEAQWGLPYPLHEKRVEQCGLKRVPWVVPVLHPAAGLHSADAQPDIWRSFRRFGQLYRGELPLVTPVDQYPNPDYREITTSKVSLLPDLPVYIDTEGLLPDSVWGLSYTQAAGRARVIKASNPRALESFCRQLKGRQLVMHHALHDIPIVAALLGMTVEEFLRYVGVIDDTMVKAYCLGGVPQALKPAGRRFHGMKMEGYLDVVRDADREIAIDFLRHVIRDFKCQRCKGDGQYVDYTRVSEKTGKQLAPMAVTCPDCKGDGTALPAPDERLVREKGRVRVSTGWRIGQTARRILKDLRIKGSEVDPRKRWDGVDYVYRAKVEDVTGPMREVSLNDVKPPERAMVYSCLAGDALVLTEDGPRKLSALVRDRYAGRVWSVDTNTHERVLRPVVNWYRTSHGTRVRWMSIETDVTLNGRWGGMATRYTPDHRLLTADGAWKRVDELAEGDMLASGLQRLTTVQRQVVLGSLLGDGGLTRRNSGGWVQFRTSHAEKQRPYTEWEQSLFPDTTVMYWPPSETVFRDGRRAVRQAQYGFAIPSSAELLPIYQRMYSAQKNEKVLDADFVKNLDWLALAIWYQDDGCLVGSKTARMYTLAFSPASIQLLRDRLAAMGVETTAYNVAGTVSRMFTQSLHVRAASAQTFFSKIAPYVHPVMRYKLPVEYHDVAFEQVPLSKGRGMLPARVTRVYDNPVPVSRRGSVRTSYCLDVEGTHNFITGSYEVAHNCRDADTTNRYSQTLDDLISAEGPQIQKIYEIDRGTLPLLAVMMDRGTWVDVEYLNKLDGRLERECDKILYKLERETGRYINPNSSKQVAELLFDELKLPVLRYTDGGDPSTQDKVLEDLRLQVAALPVTKENGRRLRLFTYVTDYRERHKLRGTYTLALPRAADKNGRVHTTFNSTRTTTNRLSSSEPNLQNIPARTELGKLVRGAFAAPDGWELVSVDYSQIEVVVVAHVSQDKHLIDALCRGLDIHTVTAARIFKKKVHTKGCECGKCPTVKQRYIAKRITFLILYGGGAELLKAVLKLDGVDVSVDEAQGYIDAYLHEAYPGLGDYLLESASYARRYGYVEDMHGWRRYLPGVHSKIRSVRMEAERMAGNAPIQGGAAGITRLACPVILEEAIPYVRKKGYDCYPLLTVHDEIVAEVEAGGGQLLSDALVRAMVGVMKLDAPIKASGAWGKRWSELK